MGGGSEEAKRSRMAGHRRQFLVYMAPEWVKAIKLAALKRDVSASLLVEEAVKEWLAAHEPEPEHVPTTKAAAASKRRPRKVE